MRRRPPGARVVLAGIPDDDRTSFPAGLARRKGLTIVMARRMNDVYPRAIGLVARGPVDVDWIVTHRYPLAESARRSGSRRPHRVEGRGGAVSAGRR